MRYLIAVILTLVVLAPSCSSDKYSAECQQLWDSGLVAEELQSEQGGETFARSKFLKECEQGMEELVKGLPEVIEALAELSEAFTAPPCLDLIDGQPVPTEFLEDNGELTELECELDDTYLGSWRRNRCEATDRSYYSNDYGWAYTDDKIFHLGDVPDNCSMWYVPPCLDLIDGQPVPTEFLEDDGKLTELDCELNDSITSSFWAEVCKDTGRDYFSNSYGWAYQDDKIFHLGDVPDNCSKW
jgi:hypothetical protein